MSAKIVYKLKPEAPMVWTSANTLQFGLDSIIFETGIPSAGEQTLLLALKEGRTEDELFSLANQEGFSKEQFLTFLDRFASVIETQSAKPLLTKPTLSIIGHITTETFVARQLQRRSLVVTAGALKRGSDRQLVVSADRYFPNIQSHRKLLHDGHKVIPSRFGDQTILLGPVITNFEEHEILMEQWRLLNHNVSNKYASQLCHLPTPTEKEPLLLIYSGLILDQLQSFLNPSGARLKTYEIKKVDKQILVTPRFLENTQEPQTGIFAS